MELLQGQGDILKLVLMPTTGEQSILQGFDIGVINSNVSEILMLVGKAPKHIRDIFVLDDGEQRTRLETQNPIVLISKENIYNIPGLFETNFCIIFCVSKDYHYVKEFSKQFVIPPIICSDSKLAELKFGEINSIYSYDKFIFSRLKLIESKIIKKSGEKKLLTRFKRRGATFKRCGLSSTLNNTTLPNELLIESLGFMLSPPKRIKDGSSKREFINAMLDGVVTYKNCLEELGKEPPSEIILYAPGMYSYLYDTDNEIYEFIEENLNIDQKKFLIGGVLRNPDYSGFRIVMEHDGGKKNNISRDPVFRYLIKLRRSEMRLTTTAIMFLSMNKKIPAIRLPNAINHQSNIIKKIEDLARQYDIKHPVFIKKVKAFNTIIKRILGAKLRDHISKNYNDITFVTDTPLDWIRIGHLPIMFSHEISRVNTTPGNVLLQNAASFPRVLIKSSELKKVLIIRSFEPDDHIKFHLEHALDCFMPHMPDLQYEIVDVRTKKEFMEALNHYDGYLLVLDCHGDHGGDKSHGWLIIGEERIDTWELRKIVRVPPIVILSACLTSALSGSHASVANGFLISGAVSVIGTLLPVNSVDSAAFVSRLIYRFHQFPSSLPTMFTHMNLRLFISLFFRMSYVTDLMRAFELEGVIPQNSWEEDAIEINMHINMFDPDWYGQTLRALTKLSGLEEYEVVNLINEKFFITETMCYSQIGFPEAVTISVKE